MPSARTVPVPLQSTLPPRVLTGRLLAILLAQTAFSFGWSLYLLQPKFLATHLGAQPAEMGRIAAMGGLAAIATIPLVANGLDRWGRRPFLWGGCGLLTLLSLGYLMVSELGPLVYVLQGCVGAAFVVTFNATATLVSDEAPPERLGQTIGLLGAAGMSMNGIAVVIAERLVASLGWDAVFGLGAAAGMTALAISCTVRETPRSRVSEAPDTLGAPPHDLWRVLGTAVMVGAAFIAMFVFLQPYALDLGAANLSPFFVGFTCAAVGVRVGLGSLGDRFGHRAVSIAALLIYAVTTLATARLVPSLLWAYGAAFGLAHGMLYPTLNALALKRAAGVGRGKVMTLYNGAFNLGTASSNWLWGALAGSLGYPWVFAAAACAASVGALLLVRRGHAG